MIDKKFRAWVEPQDIFCWTKEKPVSGKMFTGFSFKDISSGRDEANVFADTVWEEPKWDNAKIMQFTGLKDKNGKDIYEGDVLKVRLNDELNLVDKVHFFTDTFLCGDNYSLSEIRHEALVIGNVYENPELLKEIK